MKTCKYVGKMIKFKKELLKNGSLNSQQLNNNLEISLKLRRNPETMYRPLTKLELSKSLHLKKENKLGTILVKDSDNLKIVFQVFKMLWSNCWVQPIFGLIPEPITSYKLYKSNVG